MVVRGRDRRQVAGEDDERRSEVKRVRMGEAAVIVS